jgi:hypothetical protein
MPDNLPAADNLAALGRALAAPRYVTRKITDPRSRGACCWFEVEAVHVDGSRDHVATADTRDEARGIVAAMRAAAAARAAGDARRALAAAEREAAAAYARCAAVTSGQESTAAAALAASYTESANQVEAA